MYKDMVKIARIVIAKNQAKKLLEYFKNESPNGLTNDQIQLIKQKIVTIQKQSFNFVWFVHRFMAQHKHFQDIDPLLKVTKAYSKLNKEKRTFDFNDNKSFSDFHNFMESYLNKNIKNQEFKKPSYCKLIHSDGKYNYYYADAEDEKCYQDLHQCNTKQDGNQYAMWCVVTGEVDWGGYTTSQFPFYVYVTYKNNIPVMLFNFGYDQDCQIKDIHDDPFTKYDQELLNSIKQLAKKYNFNISENRDDFKTFNKIDELYNKQLDELNIDQSIISESKKYNGLNFIQQDIIYDFKKNKKAYLIANNNIVNLQGYKINLYLLNLLKDKKYSVVLKLAKNDKFISSCSQQVFTFIIQILIDDKEYDYLIDLIVNDKIKDENKAKQIIQVFIDMKNCYYIYDFIKNYKIKDENQLKQSIQVFIDEENHFDLCQFIQNNKIKDENLVKYTIQVFIDKKDYGCLYSLIKNNKIKDENQIKQSVQCLIDNEKYDYLSFLIRHDNIKDENQIKEIIQVFIDMKQNYLYELIALDKIKDENQFKQSVQVLIDNKVYDDLYNLIENDKIKDENQLKQIIQILIDNKVYDSLIDLIKNDKIKDENQLKQIIQILIDNKKYDSLIGLTNYHNTKNENIVKQIIQVLIDKEQYKSLCFLIVMVGIKDENQLKQSIQVLINKEQYKGLYFLIKGNLIKDENQLKQSIQVLINKEQYSDLQNLIKENKINQSLLTQEQKELLQKRYPNFKLSKKLVKLAKILKG